jgi:ribosomal 30S subunit maturation factor RimM
MWGGPQDVYEIKDENGNTCLVPACKEFIKNVDVKNKRMTINLIDGLHPL